MGDRVFVELTVPAEYGDRVREIAEESDGVPENEYDNDTHCGFYFHEVNHGELSFLDRLQAEGIAYDSEWESGYEFGKGTKSCRFNEQGEAQVLEVYDDQYGIAPEKLLEILDSALTDGDKLQDFSLLISEHLAKTKPWPWENQVEFGKRYRARQLITGGSP